MKDKKTFGSFIKEKRINKNYSQKDLAELLYVTESAVSKWERGVTYPDITLITDICRVLEISEKELIQSSDDTEYLKIKRDSDKFKKLKKVLFWTFNISYSIALLVCFIVNLAVNHTLSWFFIVLAAILVAYTFCPTITWVYEKFKKLLFIGSTFVSLFLLFLTCSIYTHNYWFMIPTIGVLLGYFIIFYPILFKCQKKYLDNDKYNKLSKWFLLSYSLGILIIILLLLIVIYCYNPFNLGIGFLITSGCMTLPIIFGVIIGIYKHKLFKITLFSFIGLFILVVILGLGRSIYLESTKENNTHIIDKTFDSISFDCKTDDINISLSNQNKVVYSYNSKMTVDIDVVNNTLVIERIDDRKFYDQMFNFSGFKIDLYLSINTINSLEINSSTSDININKGFSINNTNIDISTGDISISDCSLGDTDIKTSTGDIELLNVNCSKLDIETSTGKTKLINTIVENDFNMNGETGNLILDGFDAKNIYIELSTGDVKGTILSSKFFIAKSDTGIVKVPNTREGGECRITVDTGDIIVTYK